VNLKIYNYLTRKKEPFKPIKKGSVGFYACGPTVYDYAHIGNLRTYVFEDVLKRVLEVSGFKVKEIMNITDIEDKIIAGAKKAGKNIDDFSKPYKKAFFEDLNKLNIKKSWKYPEATKHIPEMVKMAEKLLQKKIAYQAKDGIYFNISKFKSYGQLANPKPSDRKDFVIWKYAKKGEPFWKSPFGPGRPGWHLECSAMSMRYLGASFDIHAGGVDLLFPHHENEIAQSEGATGKRFVKYFVEGEHLLVDGNKMSKSLGNVFTLRDLACRGFNPIAFRYLALSANYRSRLNFTWESLEAAQVALDRLYEFIFSLHQNSSFSSRLTLPRNSGGSDASQKIKSFGVNFQKAIFDDLNTPKALAVIWQLIKDYNKSASRRTQKYAPKEVLSALYGFDEILGLGFKNLKAKSPSEIALKLLKERERARKTRDFKKADRIRERIRRLGWQVNDTPTGSNLNPVTSHD